MKKRKTVILLGIIACTLVYQTIPNREEYWFEKTEVEKKDLSSNAIKAVVNQKVRTYPTPIIILTYMRSGSSFVGDLLQQSNEVFYLFEPLRLPQFEMRKNKTYHSLKGDFRYYSNFLDASRDLIRNWTTCKLLDLPRKVWEDGFLPKSKKAKLFKACQVFQENVLSSNDTLYSCVKMLRDICLQSKYVLMKIIRTPLDQLEPLMTEFPDMKIIHLLRDPRATVLSQVKFGKVRVKTFVSDATEYCTRVYRDLVSAELLKSRFPKRIKKIFYEDIAYDPKGMSKTLYDFIGTTFTASAEQYIFNITMAGKQSTCNLCTVKSNSTKQANTWRLKIPYKRACEIDGACKYMYDQLGIKSIQNEHMLRNTNIPLHTNITKIDDYRFA